MITRGCDTKMNRKNGKIMLLLFFVILLIFLIVYTYTIFFKESKEQDDMPNNSEVCKVFLQEGESKDIANSNMDNLNNALQCAHKNNITYLKVPKGNYYFNVYDGVGKSILIDFPNITLDLNESIFNVYQNNSTSYNLIKITNPEPGFVTIKNGTLIGDRAKHTCVDGSPMTCKDGILLCPNDYPYPSMHGFAHGVVIFTEDVNIENLKVSGMVGDGIYVNISVTDNAKKNGIINITNNIIENCRRNGISIIDGRNINIKNNIIRYMHGTSPQAGIDFERNADTQYYENVLIEGNSIYGNDGRWSIQIFNGVRGFLKILNNHLGDQIIALDTIGPVESDIITIANNDMNIPEGIDKCVVDPNKSFSSNERNCTPRYQDERCP